MHTPGAHEIETFTGLFVDTRKPKAETVCLEDIAHGLANTCRFGGQCAHYYSVAEHAVYCALYAKNHGWTTREQLACLHHDDAEAYLGDIPRPMKSLLGQAYKSMTDRMDAAVITALKLPFGVEELHGPEVREADNFLLMSEARALLPSQGRGWGGQACNWELDMEVKSDTPDDWTFSLRPHAAEALYLHTHRSLMKS